MHAALVVPLEGGDDVGRITGRAGHVLIEPPEVVDQTPVGLERIQRVQARAVPSAEPHHLHRDLVGIGKDRLGVGDCLRQREQDVFHPLEQQGGRAQLGQQ